MPKIDFSARDRQIIELMLQYCDQLQETLREIDENKDRFFASHTYQNAVAMCILQLGELTKQLSPAFLSVHTEIPWQMMARTRDYYAHHYGSMDFAMVWETAISDIPSIRNFFVNFLNQH